MLSRRIWLWIPLFGMSASACATVNPRRPGYTLAEALQILPLLHTGSEVIEKFGEPNDRETFSHDDPKNEYLPNRDSLENLRRENIETPLGLMDKTPIGTRMMLYYFVCGIMDGPVYIVLFVFIDKNDLVIGWMYDKELASKAKTAWAEKPR